MSKQMKGEEQPMMAAISISHGKSLKAVVNSIKLFWESNSLLILTMAGVVAGIIVGILVRALGLDPSEDTIYLTSIPGELLIRMLKMLMLPLLTSSLITGMAHLDIKLCGKIGSRAMVYYLGTTLFATTIGVVLVLLIQPGHSNEHQNRHSGVATAESPVTRRVTTVDTILDIIRNIIPDNLILACTQQVATVYKDMKILDENGTETSYFTRRSIEPKDGTNFLGLISFSIVFGLVVSHLGPDADILEQFFSILNNIIMKMVKLIMWYSPLGIGSLLAAKIMEMEEIGTTMNRLGLYMGTIIFGLGLHGCVVLPSIYYFITKKSPFRFIKGMMEALITAFATASSSATLPITFRCLEENNQIDNRVTRFILPIGATVNMDGSALYEVVSVVFIAQMNGIHLEVEQLIAIILTSTFASIGAAAIPGGALITIILVLSSVGLPHTDIPLLLTVDWILDRIRTVVNIMGDGFGAGIIQHLSTKELMSAYDRRMSKISMALQEMDGQQDVQANIPDFLRRRSSISLFRGVRITT